MNKSVFEDAAMELKDLRIGNSAKYLDIKYSKDSKLDRVRNSKEDAELELEYINKALKELGYYQYCNKSKDEECDHCHCVYAVLCFGEEFKATCGRRDK